MNASLSAPLDRAAVFEAERPRLHGLAYRLLGSVSDAEDVVQEAWFRFERADLDTIDRPGAWLMTVVSRLGLDRLRARQRERADYVGPWLPDPVMAEPGPSSDEGDPAQHAELADSLTTAFLVLLEQLSPSERLALLLADVFGEPFRDVAGALGKSEAAARQLATRARSKLRAADPDLLERRADPFAAQQRVARQFVVALGAGDIEGAARLLAPEVVLLSDGGPSRHAARRPVVGSDRVARFLVNIAQRVDTRDSITVGVTNQRPAFILRRGGEPVWVFTADVVDGLVRRIHVMVNPDKLAAVDHRLDLL
jgi:RNA polymerase sigma-70 factor (ECF subfamily)